MRSTKFQADFPLLILHWFTKFVHFTIAIIFRVESVTSLAVAIFFLPVSRKIEP